MKSPFSLLIDLISDTKVSKILLISKFILHEIYLELSIIFLYYDNIFLYPTTPLVQIGLAENCSFPGSRKNYIV